MLKSIWAWQCWPGGTALGLTSATNAPAEAKISVNPTAKIGAIITRNGASITNIPDIPNYGLLASAADSFDASAFLANNSDYDFGVVGSSSSNNGAGVYGTSSGGTGVLGFSYSGNGVYGYSTYGTGVYVGFGRQGVNPLADTGRGITTFQGKLSHEGMGKSVKKDKPFAWKTTFWIRQISSCSPFSMGFQHGVTITFTAGLASQAARADSSNWINNPSPRTSEAGTHFGFLRVKGAIRSSGMLPSSVKSPGDSMRVNPVTTLTSRRRSAKTTCLIRCS